MVEQLLQRHERADDERQRQQSTRERDAACDRTLGRSRQRQHHERDENPVPESRSVASPRVTRAIEIASEAHRSAQANYGRQSAGIVADKFKVKFRRRRAP